MASADAREAQELDPEVLCVFGNKEKGVRFTSSMYENNPRICHNIESYKGKLAWIPNHLGSRPYIKGVQGQKVIYNTDYRARPGEIYFSDKEKERIPSAEYIYVEPNVKTISDDGAQCFPIGFNKNWGFEKWKILVEKLSKDFMLIQCGSERSETLPFVRRMFTKTFREALPIIAGAKLVLTTDGACHHAAAALGRKAVVIWGEVTTPIFLGYKTHKNVWNGQGPCGSISRCQGCKEAMRKISVEEVEKAVRDEVH